MSALLGRWSSCRRCGTKAFAARSMQGVYVWCCTDATCATQTPIGAADQQPGQSLRFAPTIDLASGDGARPSSWALVERGPGKP